MSAPGTATGVPDASCEHDVRRRALDSWREDRARLVFRHVHLASLALHLELRAVLDERMPTASTDGERIFVNPYWLLRLSDEERLGVLAHEVWHNALLHFHRRAGRESSRWNLAVDHEVNGLLARDGFVLPEPHVHFAEWEGEAAEEVYERLASSEGIARLEALAEQPRGGRGRSADHHPGDDGDVVEARDLDPKVFGPIAGRRDPEWRAGLAPGAASAWSERMTELAERHPGVVPGGLVAAIARARRPDLPWQRVLADFVQRTTAGGLVWNPPSRRHLHRGLYLPSRRGERLRLAVAIDTSGSMTSCWPAVVAELAGLFAPFEDHEVRVLQCDTAIHEDARFDASHPLPETLDLRGAGGTSFEPVFARLAAEPPDALVYFTDGYGQAPVTPPPYPTLWVLSPDGIAPARWGRTVRMGE